MTEPVITTCIAANCERPSVLNSALCVQHKRQLKQAEDSILRDATRSIRSEMRQFERLLYVEPPLHSAEISHRMALPLKKVRKLLKQFKDDRA